MRFSNFKMTEKGIKTQVHSKFLNFIIAHYQRKIKKYLIKQGNMTKEDKIVTDCYINFKIQQNGGEE